MSESKDPSVPDNSFSNFMFGLTVGIVGALLLGTEEGRRVSRRLLNSLSTGLEKNEDLFREVKNMAGQAVSDLESRFGNSPPSLPDQPPVKYESPPPPPPFVSRPRPNPTYFSHNGNPLEP